MTNRPDGAPGSRACALYFCIMLMIVVTIVVAILAYRQAPSTPDRGRSTLPEQAAASSGSPSR